MRTDAPPTRVCPKCRQTVFASAVRCQFCQALLDPTVRLPQATGQAVAGPLNANEKWFLVCSVIIMIMGIVRIVVGTGLGNQPSFGTMILGVLWIIFAVLMTQRNQFIRDHIVWFAGFGLIFDILGVMFYQSFRVFFHPGVAIGVLLVSLLEGSAFAFLLIKRDEWL